MSSKKHLKDHSELKGTHSILSASQNAWLRYNNEQLYNMSYVAGYATKLGTVMHELGAELIAERIKLNENDKHLVLHHLAKNKIPRNVYNLDELYPNFMNYVNDAIGFRMEPEKVLYYSDIAYGTADASCFRNNLLRIHDYKSGVHPAKMDQLKVYAAYYCLEHGLKPGEIDMELRIYQGNNIVIYNPTAEDILPVMDKIVSSEKFISKLIAEGEM